MDAASERIHTVGPPTAERIRQQREEQLQALRIALGMLDGSAIFVTRQERRESLRRLCTARGLPTR